MLNRTRWSFRTAVALAAALAAARSASAGPPLICHPFDAGTASVLPWATGTGWNTPDRSYDTTRLVSDTLRLLAPDTPVLARMENLRRATIYASRDSRVAGELMAAVLGRALGAAAERPRDPLAWFDAGYLVESYRQMGVIGRRGAGIAEGAVPEVDGYRLVQKAIELAGASPEMEYAASLMKEGPRSAEHRRRAVEGAKPGSLLAKNLH
jgi:hypothetical protein